MEEHVQKLMDALTRATDFQHAIETLEIEQSRLIEAIRAMRAMAVSEDDYPGTRVKEQKDALHNVEQVIAFLRQAVETSRREVNLMAERRFGSNPQHSA